MFSKYFKYFFFFVLFLSDHWVPCASLKHFETDKTNITHKQNHLQLTLSNPSLSVLSFIKRHH